MKNIVFTLVTIFCASYIHAQNDTMYVMKNGVVIHKQSIKATDVDSIIFYQPQVQTGSAFTDSRDGNVYKTVTIGNQVWMAENLKYLPTVVGPATRSLTVPYYYVHSYNGTVVADAKATVNYATYGVLYNWQAAMNGATSSSANPSGVRGVCPAGWHLPSEAEWLELAVFLGGLSVAGGKLKEEGTVHWTSPNEGATNESRFTGLPGGYISIHDSSLGLNFSGYWSNATEDHDINRNKVFTLFNTATHLSTGTVAKEMGLSVRCVRD